jgi:hypothetical protein
MGIQITSACSWKYRPREEPEYTYMLQRFNVSRLMFKEKGAISMGF